MRPNDRIKINTAGLSGDARSQIVIKNGLSYNRVRVFRVLGIARSTRTYTSR